MAFRSDLNALILATLKSEPLHGYQIVRALREAGGAGKMADGQIYPYLHKLEEQGLVSAEWQTETGAAARKVYKLSPAGLLELEEQKKKWAIFSQGVSSLLMTEFRKMRGSNV